MSDLKKPGGSDLRQARSDIRKIFSAALDAADAGRLINKQVRLDGEILSVRDKEFDISGISRIFVAGFGKASARMAASLEEILGDRIADGLVIVKYGYSIPLKRIGVPEAGHPFPDARGVQATEELVGKIRTCGEDDLVIFLISGGGSSLLVLPSEGLTLEEKIQTTRLMLSSGATIEEINTVRRHLSAVKGGKLLPLVYPAASLGIILSDVIGDRLETIASGPTVHVENDYTSALQVIDKYDLASKIPAKILEYLEEGSPGEMSASPENSEGSGFKISNVIIGNNESLLEGARRKAEELGYRTKIMARDLDGEARDEARKMVSIAAEPPACLLFGGETTVTVRGDGRGGRCQEFALSAALSLEGQNIVVLAAGSDGTDGPTDATGAIADGETCRKGRNMGLEPADFLDRNDSYTYFEALGDLLVTGPTATNVMDLYICLIL
jgi:glycerate-2-kinase